MNKPILLLSFFCFCLRLSAQEVQINEDPKITQLTKTWTNHNRATPGIDGWRVQIMASADREQVESGRNKFRTEYPEVSGEWILEKPYYKLRVGAFRNKQEALAFISELNNWPGAYPAKDASIHPHVAHTRMGPNSRRASLRRESTMLVTREKPGALHSA